MLSHENNVLPKFPYIINMYVVI